MYFGPFRVKDKISSVAYKLELSARNNFHVSKLNPFKGSELAEMELLPILAMKNEPLLYPTTLLDFKNIYRQVLQTLVRWSGALTEYTSWEDNVELVKVFPSLHLEGKVEFQGSGHVTAEVDTNLILDDLR